MFDTSLLHEAANEAESVRYILMLRVWHPDLSPQEVWSLLTRSLPCEVSLVTLDAKSLLSLLFTRARHDPERAQSKRREARARARARAREREGAVATA